MQFFYSYKKTKGFCFSFFIGFNRCDLQIIYFQQYRKRIKKIERNIRKIVSFYYLCKILQESFGHKVEILLLL